VLESGKEKEWKRVGCAQRTAAQSRCTGVSGGAPECPAPGWALVNWPLSGIRRRRTTIIHWTVRWCTGLSGEPTAARTTVGRAICARRVAHANGRLGAPDSVRCANQPEDPTVGCARNGRRSASDMLQWLSGGAPNCPVRHPTEGKNCLPCWVPTAPSCLGAIKGTPRHMEETPKHTLSILNLPHSVSAHLIDFLSDLSSVLVVNLLRFIRAQVLAMCVRIAADLCVLLPSLTLVPSLRSLL
jgi:hypothetical protein